MANTRPGRLIRTAHAACPERQPSSFSLAAILPAPANAPEERTIDEVVRAMYQKGTSQRAARCQESMMKVAVPGSKQ
jgi:hypothetical protein